MIVEKVAESRMTDSDPGGEDVNFMVFWVVSKGATISIDSACEFELFEVDYVKIFRGCIRFLSNGFRKKVWYKSEDREW